ncbi:hypothetical protein jhhlp_005133 [Lomentospora prolificans]|uniref:Uncharacterized protein n=1 Tax=Lomentospora prolificans TaxID=41688 RepID=A0A2N3N7T1_9PEZI|nr:hypothetical protein jhhlp_005133 [Lomentospora prolificans]
MDKVNPNFIDGGPTLKGVDPALVIPDATASLTGSTLSTLSTATSAAPSSVITPGPDPVEIPELCGFKDRTTPVMCAPGETCMFNTDIYAAACCTGDSCSWKTTCCGYTLSDPAPSVCGNGLSFAAAASGAYSLNSQCITYRFESGFTMYAACWTFPAYSESIHFTTAGATTAWPGLPRLTGSNGPPTKTATTAGAVETVVTKSTNAGAIAGSVIGGIALGILLTVGGWFFYRRLAAKRLAAVAPTSHQQVQQVPAELGQQYYESQEMDASRAPGGYVQSYSPDHAYGVVPSPQQPYGGIEADTPTRHELETTSK